MKLGILSTHPIQYYVPLYRYLTAQEGLDLTVFYAHQPSAAQLGVGFNIAFKWDVDLTSGYNHVWLKNESKEPHLQTFEGCDTPEIKNIISREQFDAFLVLGWYTKSMWQAMRACWQTQTPIFVRGDSHLRLPLPYYKKLIKKITYPRFIKRFSGCFAVGKWSADYFTYYRAKQVIHSPHFVDGDWFRQQLDKNRSSASAIRDAWSLHPDETTFLFVGKFEEEKRPLDFLCAIEKLLANLPSGEKIRGLMVGDGLLRRACESFCQEKDLPVTFTGFLNQTEMPKAYLVADVIVLPSNSETWGLVINEAMSCGLPAIVSDHVGCGPDLVFNNQTGFIYPLGDVQALSRHMLTLSQKSVAHEMGHMAKAHVAQYSVKAAGSAIVNAMNSSC
ncbi:MAG: glycosyltransferase family 4 protein [Phormidesmis sp.]